MTYEEIVEFVKKNVKKPAKSKRTHIAVEFDIYGEGEGAFYVEVKDGKVSVEPYEYYDRDAKVIITSDELVNIVGGSKKASESIEDGILMLEGDGEIAAELFELFKAEKKAAAKKETKKPAAKKVKKEASKKSKEKKAETAAKKEDKKAVKAESAKKSVKVEEKIVKETLAPKSKIKKDILK